MTVCTQQLMIATTFWSRCRHASIFIQNFRSGFSSSSSSCRMRVNLFPLLFRLGTPRSHDETGSTPTIMSRFVLGNVVVEIPRLTMPKNSLSIMRIKEDGFDMKTTSYSDFPSSHCATHNHMFTHLRNHTFVNISFGNLSFSLALAAYDHEVQYKHE